MQEVVNRFRCVVSAMAMVMGMAAAGAHAQCDPADLYGPGQQFATGVFPISVAIGDFDGDGTPDLAVTNFFSNTVSVLLNQCGASGPCNAADLAEPFGILDLADILAFVTAFGAEDPIADFAPPFGVFDLADILGFVTAFQDGCP